MTSGQSSSVVSDPDLHWLQQIYDYISRDNEEAAWKVILGIYDPVQLLRQFPESGHRYEKYPDKHIRYYSTVITASRT